VSTRFSIVFLGPLTQFCDGTVRTAHVPLLPHSSRFNIQNLPKRPNRL
jgi:hypothetical protein